LIQPSTVAFAVSLTVLLEFSAGVFLEACPWTTAQARKRLPKNNAKVRILNVSSKGPLRLRDFRPVTYLSEVVPFSNSSCAISISLSSATGTDSNPSATALHTHSPRSGTGRFQFRMSEIANPFHGICADQCPRAAKSSRNRRYFYEEIRPARKTFGQRGRN